RSLGAWAVVCWLFPAALLAQTNMGELRLRVTDPHGLGIKASIQIDSEANQYRNTLITSEQGSLDVLRLPFGFYRVEIRKDGFAEVAESVQIRSSVTTEYRIQLQLSSV